MSHYLGDGSGGYYVETRISLEDGGWSLWSPEFTGDGTFANWRDPDLQVLLDECDGELLRNGF